MPGAADPRDVAIGAAAIGVRAGVRAGRVALVPLGLAMRAPKRISAGWDAILPATSASPWPKVLARSIRPTGTNEKVWATWPRSAVEFIRMRTRLSHCESTFSWTFCGRWVTTTR